MSTSTTLGGTASGVKIHKVAYGLMMMTWTPTPTPDEQAFEAIKTAVSLVPEDQKLLINSGEFYGVNPRTANLQLLARFFTKYPELAERCFLSVKGGTEADSLVPNGSPENVRRSVDAVLAALDGKKSLDMFECARVDSRVPLEETYNALKQLQTEGKFGHIGISEVGPDTLRKANEIVQIAAVEIELSPWSYEEPGQKVVQVAKELGIAVVAYSPLGRGFLTGQMNPSDLPDGDFRKGLARFQAEALKHNQSIVDALTRIATKKGISNAQLSLAFVSALGPHVVPMPGSSKPHRIQENFASLNTPLTPEEFDEILQVMGANPAKGGRYTDGKYGPEHLWS